MSSYQTGKFQEGNKKLYNKKNINPVDDENAKIVRDAEANLKKKKKGRKRGGAANPQKLSVFKALLFTNAAINPREFFSNRKKQQKEDEKKAAAEAKAGGEYMSGEAGSPAMRKASKALAQRVEEEMRAERGEVSGIAGGGYGDDDDDFGHDDNDNDDEINARVEASSSKNKSTSTGNPYDLRSVENQSSGLDHMFALAQQNPILTYPPRNRFEAREVLLGGGCLFATTEMRTHSADRTQLNKRKLANAGATIEGTTSDPNSKFLDSIDEDDPDLPTLGALRKFFRCERDSRRVIIHRRRIDTSYACKTAPDAHGVSSRDSSTSRGEDEEGGHYRSVGSKYRGRSVEEHSMRRSESSASSVSSIVGSNTKTNANQQPLSGVSSDAASTLFDRKAEQEEGVKSILSLLGQRLAATRPSDPSNTTATASKISKSQSVTSPTRPQQYTYQSNVRTSTQSAKTTHTAATALTDAQLTQQHINELGAEMLSDATFATRTTATLAASANYHHRQLDAYIGMLYDFNHQLFTSLPLKDMLFQLTKIGRESAANLVAFTEAQIGKRVHTLDKEHEANKMALLLAAAKEMGADAYQNSQIAAEQERHEQLMAEMAALYPEQYASPAIKATSPPRLHAQTFNTPSANINTRGDIATPFTTEAPLYDSSDKKADDTSSYGGASSDTPMVKHEAIDYEEMEKLYREQLGLGLGINSGASMKTGANNIISDPSSFDDDEEELMIVNEREDGGPHPDDEDPESFMMQIMMGVGAAKAAGTSHSQPQSNGDSNANPKSLTIAPSSVLAPSTRRVLTFADDGNLVIDPHSTTPTGNNTPSSASTSTVNGNGTLGSTQEATLRLD